MHTDDKNLLKNKQTAKVVFMKITNLKLTNFRSIESANIQLNNDANIIALYGENGAGKTSVLEALSLLSPGRGLHRHKLESHIQHGTKNWGIYSELTTHNKRNHSAEERSVGMLYEKGKRTLKIDGEKTKTQSELSHLGNILWFTPKMDRLFMDSASARREFIDRLVFGQTPEHAFNLNRYKHHLKSRLKLLKENGAREWIDIEEEQAALYAEKISSARLNFIAALKPYLDAITLNLTGSFERLEDKSATSIQKELENNRARDGRFGTSHFGPHRSGTEGILHPEDIPLVETSTGQHKRAVLEILLANARLTHATSGQAPVILLDEMASHLDSKTKEKFFGSLAELGTQIWLTGTEKEMFEKLTDVQFIHTENGQFNLQG